MHGENRGEPRGVIDLGTNSVRVLVGRSITVRPGASLVPPLEILLDRGITARLGEGLRQGGRVSPEAEERAESAVAELAAAARALGAPPMGLATEALRGARNGLAVARRIQAATGCPIRILQGLEEASLTLEGSRDLLPRGRSTLLWDIGGGSTEIIRGSPEAPEMQSIPLGCVTYAGPPPEEAWEEAVTWVSGRISGGGHTSAPPGAASPGSLRAEPALALGGTVTSAAFLDLGLTAWDRERVQGHVLTTAGLEEWGRRIARRDETALERLNALDAHRAPSMAPGLAILVGLTRSFGVREVRVSTRGLRFGYLSRGGADTIT